MRWLRQMILAGLQDVRNDIPGARDPQWARAGARCYGARSKATESAVPPR